MNYNTKVFSKQLASAMKQFDVSIEAVAKKVGVTVNTVCNWLKGPASLPSVANLYKLAKAVNVSMDDLINGAIMDERKKVYRGEQMNATASKIVEFYNELPAGSLFTLSSITLRTGLTRGQIYAARTNIPSVAQLLSITRISRSDYQKPYHKYDSARIGNAKPKKV